MYSSQQYITLHPKAGFSLDVLMNPQMNE